MVRPFGSLNKLYLVLDGESHVAFVFKKVRTTEEVDFITIMKEMNSILTNMPKGLTNEALCQHLRRTVHCLRAPLNIVEKGHLLQMLLDEVLGYGPLGPLLRDHEVSTIAVLGHDCIEFVKRGARKKSPWHFQIKVHLLELMDKIEAVEQPVDLKITIRRTARLGEPLIVLNRVGAGDKLDEDSLGV